MTPLHLVLAHKLYIVDFLHVEMKIQEHQSPKQYIVFSCFYFI